MATNAAAARHLRAVPTTRDLELLSTAMGAAAGSLGAEQFGDDAYLDEVIAKPWGLEYRVYADTFYDVWKLRLRPGHSTSTHCHPRKDTALLCLAGSGVTHLLNEGHPVRTGDVIHIRRGVFHRTENAGEGVLDLVEIELPRNKLDLVRSGDQYGRAGQRYETETIDGSVAAMAPAELVAHSRLRRVSLTSEYRFDVRRGIDIRADGRVRFVVSLALERAVANDIEVLAPGDRARVDPAGTYFTISTNP